MSDPYDLPPVEQMRAIRLPKKGGTLKTVTVALIVAILAAAGLTLVIIDKKELGALKMTQPSPSPVEPEKPIIQAPAPAPRIIKPEEPQEAPKAQERVGGDTADSPKVTAPLGQDNGVRQVPLTPRPVQTTPFIVAPFNPPAAVQPPTSAPLEAPLPKARPKG